MPVRRSVALVAPLLTIVTLATGLSYGGTPVRADPLPTVPAGTYYLQNTATGWNIAAAQNAVQQHHPRGDEDHQQWSVRADGGTYLIENADTAGRCLGHHTGAATMTDCAGADAHWQLNTGTGPGYAITDPDTGGFLGTVGDTAPLSIGGDNPAARWYLTPLTLPTGLPPAPDDRRLDQVTFLTAHNAFANGKDGGFAPPVINLFPNQDRGLQQQLTDGVRGFMLDIYPTAAGATLCHQSCTLVSNPLSLSAALNRIVAFLHANSTEFVTVFLEDYVDAPVLRAELAKVAGLGELLYHPDVDGVREHGWPTMGTLRQRGTRLLIFTDHSWSADAAAGLTRDSFGVYYQRDWTVENYWSMGAGVGTSDWSCYSRWGIDIPLTRTESHFHRLFVMNHFRDTPLASTITVDNGKILDRARRFCEPAARTKPTFLAVDRYDLGDPAAAVREMNTYLTVN